MTSRDLLRLSLALVGGCGGCGEEPRAVVDAGAPVDAAASAAPAPSGWAWQRAADGDAVALMRLAEEEGASRLLDEARRGTAVALDALALAPDAVRVLPELATLAAERAERRDEVLRACLAIAERRPVDAEAVDGAVVAEASKAFQKMADDAALAASSRALARSTARALQRASGAEPAD
jgi:hypothetical protein